MSDEKSDVNKEAADGVDDRRMILPYVNTQTRLIPGIQGMEPKTAREGVVYVPAGLALVAAGLAFSFSAFMVGFILITLSLPLLAVGVHLNVMMSRAWYLTPDGVLREYLSYRFLKRSMPWGHEKTMRNTHNIRRVHDSNDGDEK